LLNTILHRHFLDDTESSDEEPLVHLPAAELRQAYLEETSRLLAGGFVDLVDESAVFDDRRQFLPCARQLPM
jgi:hypothetical protein